MRGSLVLAVALVLAACTKQEADPPPAPGSTAQSVADEAPARAADLDARLATMQAVSDTFSAGEASSRFVAYWESGVLRVLDERSEFGDYGSGSARYYLDTTGALFLYRARDEMAADDPARAGTREVTQISMTFEPDGRLLASGKTVDGKVQPVLATEIEGVRQHWAALRAAAGASPR
jgi:hypothetical protein